MFGKVKGIHKGQHMRPEAAQVRVVESLDGGFLASAVHPLSLFENRQLRDDAEILKKASAFFACELR